MSFYRSDEMSYYRLVIPRQNAWSIMNRLGQDRLLHIVPGDTAVLARPFLSSVRRCEEALHHIRNLEKKLSEKGIYERKEDFSQAAYHQIFRLWDDQYVKSSGHPASVLSDLIGQIQNGWNYHEDLAKRQQILLRKLQSVRDNIAILKAGEMRFGREFFTVRGRADDLGRNLFESSKINYQCGVIKLEEELRFKKTLFRITKGNSLVVCIPFRDFFANLFPAEETRAVFYVLYPGGGDNYLQRKILRLVQNFSSGEYQLPYNDDEFIEISRNLESSFVEAQNLLTMTQGEMADFLNRFVDPMGESEFFRRHQYLKLYFLKEKDLYTTLNEMEVYSNFMQGKVYVRTCDVQKLQRTINQLQAATKQPVGQLVAASADKMPTYFQTNSFTVSAQEIIQTYGVAKYGQANPAFFTVVTFPFLFGVMFGDIGHGSILFAFGLYLIFGVGQMSSNIVFKMLRPHRYIITLMGFFAMYCGIIYNDYLSMSLDLFGSCFDVTGVVEKEVIPQVPGCVYPMGLDPVWAVAQNNLNFINSLKMKISVIIAVVHMTLGVLVKASNTIHFGQWLDFFCQFIPQLIFLVLLFGYMDFLIVFKWLKNWDFDTNKAPSIITSMINMPLKLGKTQDCCGGQPMWGVFGDTSQNTIQLWFLVIAVICIPWMLIPKPLVLIYCGSKNGHQIREGDEEEFGNNHTGRLLSGEHLENEGCICCQYVAVAKKAGEDDGSNQIFVHQLIETIEYVLGCISNTASYLRLWALSLAHSQLSQVFFDKLVKAAIVNGFKGIPMMLIGFVCLAGITFGVLLCMDSMECFLHTLRLHWVEFNNKFYKGSGFSFVFYSFKKRIAEQLNAEG